MNTSASYYVLMLSMGSVPILPSIYHQITSTLYINGLPIVCCNQHKDLGIVMSPDLNWESHITFISSKAYKKLGLLQRTFSSAVSIIMSKTKSLSYISEVSASVLLTDLETLFCQGYLIIRKDTEKSYKIHPWRLYIQLQITITFIATPPTHDGVYMSYTTLVSL